MFSQDSIEASLQIVHDISTENIGTLCISKQYSPLKIPLNTERYDGARQKSDLASVILQDLGFNRHSGEYLRIDFIFFYRVVCNILSRNNVSRQ